MNYVFMDDKRFCVSSCSFVPGSFENSANHGELLFAPPHVLRISSVEKEEDVRCHLPCLQSTEKILTTATAIWTISCESFVSYLHPANGRYEMLYN